MTTMTIRFDPSRPGFSLLLTFIAVECGCALTSRDCGSATFTGSPEALESLRVVTTGRAAMGAERGEA